MKHTHTISLLALLTLTRCTFVGEVGSLAEDPQLGEVEPTALRVNPSGEMTYTTQSAMPACGTVLATFDGTPARSNGSSTATGYSCGGSGASGLYYQCPELVMRHYQRKWGFRWHGDAKDLLAKAPADKVAVYYNGDAAHPPVPGDAVVWTNGAVGHVALVTAVRADAVDIIEQNVKGNGRATLPYSGGRIGARWGNWIPAGWAHVRANGGSQPSQPQPPAEQPQPPAEQPQPPAKQPGTSCHGGTVFGLSFCSDDCPCGEGEGDCDGDAQCEPGLVCAADVGGAYGAPDYIDVCRKPAAAPAPTPAPSPAPSQPGSCSFGSSGDDMDPCPGVAAETWRCVQSPLWGVPISQVCRGGVWRTYHLQPSDCGSCCGGYTAACAAN